MDNYSMSPPGGAPSQRTSRLFREELRNAVAISDAEFAALAPDAETLATVAATHPDEGTVLDILAEHYEVIASSPVASATLVRERVSATAHAGEAWNHVLDALSVLGVWEVAREEGVAPEAAQLEAAREWAATAPADDVVWVLEVFQSPELHRFIATAAPLTDGLGAALLPDFGVYTALEERNAPAGVWRQAFLRLLEAESPPLRGTTVLRAFICERLEEAGEALGPWFARLGATDPEAARELETFYQELR